MITDIVCGMRVSTSVAWAEYKGKKYFFCCEGCKFSFEKNPEKYLWENL